LSQTTSSHVLAKLLSWRILGSVITFLIVWGISGNLSLALFAVAVEIAVKTAFLFFHERVWAGKAKPRGGSKPAVLWFTGLSGAGKTTIARCVHSALRAQGVNAAWLDGDVTREFFPRTGFSKEERNAHVMRSGFIARMLAQHGVSVVASYISPYRETRQGVREMCAEFADFVEVFVYTPLEECERRDVKGLYAKARRGEVKQFTGIDDPYEKPDQPEVRIETMDCTPEQAAAEVLTYLRDAKGWRINPAVGGNARANATNRPLGGNSATGPRLT